MSKFRDNPYKYILVLGALLFLFISSSTQACVLTGHSDTDAHHSSTPDVAVLHEGHVDGHSQQANCEHTVDECCHLIPADLVDFAQAQVSNPSSQQFSSDWFHLQLANAFPSSFYSIGFAQREIISPHAQSSSVVSSSPKSSLNAGRAPPSAVLA